ncbi:FIG01200150: hypothetical protein [hydrothermal vent metagenome]|uniref:Uncharacterized protein n=1 Tax=hydrothermal vent metagenome TaxID=652676 RepID=A0A1W1CRC4_9ZZZZ
MKLLKILLPIFLLYGSSYAINTENLQKDINYIQKKWAYIKYEIPNKDEQVKEFEKLIKNSYQIIKKYPNTAEPKIWSAIIISTQAGIKGGFSALSLIKESKKLLQSAEKINPTALNGSIYTSLGSLYYKAPGWPISFGDNDKAREYLEKGVKINPNGIDINYFYGDFLQTKGEYKKALVILNHALKSKPRKNRPLADKGRIKEIKELIIEVKEMLDSENEDGNY